MPCIFEEYVLISNFYDLLLYPIMQVVILEYVVSRVLEYHCIKFDRVSMSKTWLIDILSSGSVLIEHIRPLAKHVQTRPDISDFKVGYVQSSRTVSLRWVSTSHGFLIGLLHLISSTHALFSLMFFILSWRQWLVVMSIIQSIIKISVLPLPSAINLPRDQDPAVIRRSPPPRPLYLVVVLPMRWSA
jgi:hypothetical protein